MDDKPEAPSTAFDVSGWERQRKERGGNGDESAGPTVIVAGLTRSGLSLTMQMLWAGGWPCVGVPPAFDEYPMGGIPWDECSGRAVKLVDAQLQLPPHGSFRVITLTRMLAEQVRSFFKFSQALTHKPLPPMEAELAALFYRDNEIIQAWARRQVAHLPLSFECCILAPREAATKINEFVGGGLDVDRMASVVRARGCQCYDGLLELELLKQYGQGQGEENAK